ncbi:MAG: hypothetical protein D6681_17475 [Calditrichaeota bacterium]|nr:MAG: hypothetical protein D6681_17475 [Calditrichota bacterium]
MAPAKKASKPLLVVSAYMSICEPPELIDAIAREILGVNGAVLIEVRPDAFFHRTHFVFGGRGDVPMRASLRAVRRLFEREDMAAQPGDLPYPGLVDQISFIPLESQSLSYCIPLARKFARQVAGEFHLPVYLYGQAARIPERQHFLHLRRIRYADLPTLLSQPEWKPDEGPARFVEKFGALIVGARYYHINLALYFDTEEAELIENLIEVARIAHQRRSGKTAPNWVRMRQDPPRLVRLTPKLHTFVDEMVEDNVVRVVCNIPDYRDTPLHEVYEVFSESVHPLGIRTLGSKLLGYTPLEALVDTGRYYADKKGEPAASEDPQQYVEIAVKALQLNYKEPFNARLKILDYHFSRA